MNLDVKVQRLPDGRVRVNAKGDVTSYTYQELQSTLEELVSAGERRILLDMSQVERLSSVGAGILINTHGACTGGNGSFVLISPSRTVRQVLEALGLLDMFTVSDSPDAP